MEAIRIAIVGMGKIAPDVPADLVAQVNRIQDQIKDPQGSLSRLVTRAFDALGRVQLQTGATR